MHPHCLSVYRNICYILLLSDLRASATVIELNGNRHAANCEPLKGSEMKANINETHASPDGPLSPPPALPKSTHARREKCPWPPGVQPESEYKGQHHGSSSSVSAVEKPVVGGVPGYRVGR